jgi:hypothetical protein
VSHEPGDAYVLRRFRPYSSPGVPSLEVAWMLPITSELLDRFERTFVERVMRSIILSCAAFTLATLVPATTSAQFSIEGRVGASLPIGELSDDPGLNQSFGIAVALDAMYAVAENVSLYAGGSRHSFNCDDCPADVTTSGVVGGVKYLFPGGGPITVWLRGGGMFHRASVDGSAQDWGFGVDSGLGLDIAVRRSMSIVPAVRLNSYGSGAVSLTFVTFDLGINFVPALE